MEELDALARDITNAREDRDLTQPEAAALLGVSLRAYQDWEAGKRQPRARNRKALREHFGIEFDSAPAARSELLERLDALDARLEQIAAKLKVPALPPRQASRFGEERGGEPPTAAEPDQREAPEPETEEAGR